MIIVRLVVGNWNIRDIPRRRVARKGISSGKTRGIVSYRGKNQITRMTKWQEKKEFR